MYTIIFLAFKNGVTRYAWEGGKGEYRKKKLQGKKTARKAVMVTQGPGVTRS